MLEPSRSGQTLRLRRWPVHGSCAHCGARIYPFDLLSVTAHLGVCDAYARHLADLDRALSIARASAAYDGLGEVL